jgi:hypothetical protein
MTMKRLILFLALLAPFAGSASSPDSTRHNPWSFGVILLNYSYFPKGDPDLHVFPGLVIRGDFGSFRLRSSLEAQAAFVYGETKSQTIYYLGNVDSRPQTEKGFYAYLAPPGAMSLHFRF